MVSFEGIHEFSSNGQYLYIWGWEISRVPALLSILALDHRGDLGASQVQEALDILSAARVLGVVMNVSSESAPFLQHLLCPGVFPLQTLHFGSWWFRQYPELVSAIHPSLQVVGSQDQFKENLIPHNSLLPILCGTSRPEWFTLKGTEWLTFRPKHMT
jgi:hypothetical protein